MAPTIRSCIATVPATTGESTTTRPSNTVHGGLFQVEEPPACLAESPLCYLHSGGGAHAVLMRSGAECRKMCQFPKGLRGDRHGTNAAGDHCRPRPPDR